MHVARNIARILIVVLTMLAVGCGRGALKGPTSGQIGCPTRSITITDDRMGWNSRTWTAICGERVYYCSGHGSSEGGTQVTCTEANDGEEDEWEAREQAGPSSAGCQYDAQCKGERICVDGACVSP